MRVPCNLPAIVQGFSSSRGKAARTAQASDPSGMTRQPVSASCSSMQSSMTSMTYA